jgi:hypothetical protein
MPPSPADRDRAAIVALIAEESEAYRRRDYDAWERCWVQAPYPGRPVFHSAQA